jgi:hypothetical protein
MPEPISAKSPWEGDVHVNMVTDAKNALQNGTSTVLTAVRRRAQAAERWLPLDSHEPVKPANRSSRVPLTRRMPVLPIALAVGVVVLGATGVFVVRRLLVVRYARDEGMFTSDDAPSGTPDEELVTSR